MGPKPPPPSRAELARLPRGDLDPIAVAAVTVRAAGLSAPDAPSEGDLVPNGVGWRIGVGDLQDQVYPDLAKRKRWAVAFPVLIVLAGKLSGTPGMLSLCVLYAMSAITLLGLRAPWRRVRRQFLNARPVTSLRDVPEGTLVRVTGVIAPQATVPTLFGGVPSVLSRSRMGPAQETRGVDFLLDLPDGEQAKVAVRGGFLIDPLQRHRGPPACGPLTTERVGEVHLLRSDMLRRLLLSANSGPISTRISRRFESSVGPGDSVEVCGVVHHELAAEVIPRSSRQVPTRAVLTSGEDIPLLVRRRVD